MSYGALWIASKDQPWCAKEPLFPEVSPFACHWVGRMEWAFQLQKMTWFLSSHSILCILRVTHASWQPYLWSQRTATLQKSPIKITTPLVLQRRLLKITTNRISLPEARQSGNKRPSTTVGLKSSLVSPPEEWTFAISVIFLYPPWSKSWKMLSCSGLRIPRKSRTLSPVLSLLCLSTGLVQLLGKKKYQHGGCSTLHSAWDCQWERMQLPPKELWF